MSHTSMSEMESVPLNPIKAGMVIGLLGGTLVGLGESFNALYTIYNAVLPTKPHFMESASLIAGLLFLTALYAVAGTLVFTLIGGVMALFQALRKKPISSVKLVSGFTTLFVIGYLLFHATDQLGVHELLNAATGPVIIWGLVLLVQALFVGGIVWTVMNILTEAAQRNQFQRLRVFNWPTVRNLATVILLLLIILPLGFAGLRSWGESNSQHGTVARAAAAATADRPNIILFTIDALRADHLGTYGYEKAKTPNIDAFAAAGVVFEQANSQAGWTFPSFASMFTSMYPTELNLSIGNNHITEMYSKRLDEARVTLAEALQASGYRTQAVVTNPWLNPEFGFAQGFDGFESVGKPRFYQIDRLGEMSILQIARQIPAAFEWLLKGYTFITGDPGNPKVWDINADQVVDEAVNWLDHNQDAPFFLWIHVVDAHYPYNPPEGYRPTVEGVDATRIEYLSSYNEEDVYTGRARLRPEDKAAMIALYDGEIAFTDLEFGRFLAEVDRLGLRDNTIILLSADHGDEFWEHGGYQHGQSLYDELIRVPLIVRGPGAFATPRRVSSYVQHIDMMPTLLDLIGRDAPAEAQGRSLLPLLADDAPQSEPDVHNFAEALFLTEEKKAIRSNGYKLIYLPYSHKFELYDLIDDPGELHNLADQEPAEVDRLHALINDWLLAARERGTKLPVSNSQGGADAGAIERLRNGGY